MFADSQICSQYLLVHSSLEHFTLAHSKGFRVRDEGKYSLVVNPFASDSPKTHCVPSLVCPKTPCVCLFAVNLLAFAFLLLNSLRFPNLSILLVIADSQICPQHLLVHSCLEHFTLAHSMGFREEMRERIRSSSNPFTSDSPKTHCVPSLVCAKTARVCLFAVNLLAFPIRQYSSCLRIRPQYLLVHSCSGLVSSFNGL